MTKTSLTVGIPTTLNSLEPIEIKDEQANLHAAYVERYAASNLPPEWTKEAEGFYVLLSHINPDNTFTAYVGKTNYGFHKRLQAHLKEKDYWNLAILFKKNSLQGFNQNQTAYMEGELVNALSSSKNVTVTNIKPTGDRTFNDWDKPYMEQVLLATLRILFIRGYRNAHMGAITTTLEEKPKPTITPPPTFERTALPPKSSPLPQQTQTVPNAMQNPATPQPATKSKNSLTNFDMLKQIVRTRRDNNPETAASYQYWASDKNLHRIIDAAPTTVRELSEIPLTKDWHIREYLPDAEQIIMLFAGKTTSVLSPEPEAKPLGIFGRMKRK